VAGYVPVGTKGSSGEGPQSASPDPKAKAKEEEEGEGEEGEPGEEWLWLQIPGSPEVGEIRSLLSTASLSVYGNHH